MSDVEENEGHANDLIPTPVSKLKRSYTISQKKEALEKLAKNSGPARPLKLTSTELVIPSSLLGKWAKLQDKIMNADSPLNARRIGHSGRPLKRKVIEDDVVAWTLAKRELSLSLSVDNMTSYVLRKYEEEFDGFDQCRYWIFKMLDRNELSIRRKTHDQNTAMSEQQMGDIHLDFVVHVRRLIQFHSVPITLVINMDETGSTFDIPSSTTVNKKGAKHVNIKTSNNSSSLTVFLACAVDGSKLTPMSRSQ